jgi:hypothetical protein
MNADPYEGYERRYGYCIVLVMLRKRRDDARCEEVSLSFRRVRL